MQNKHLLPNLPPRGLSREEAARYVGVSPTKFDQMVEDGRMPNPRRIDGRKVWDLRMVDAFFNRLPVNDHDQPVDANPWDNILPAAKLAGRNR
jgi:excisionase family DNA binding protein